MHRTKTIEMKWVIFFLMSLAVSVLIPVSIARAEESNVSEAVRMVHIREMHGSVDVKRSSDTDWIPAEANMELREGDRLRTAAQSSATLFIEGGETSEVRMLEGSEMLLDRLVFDASAATSDTLLDLSIGKILVTSEDLSEGSDYNVKTPTSLVGIRGTMFEVEVS